MLRSHPEYQPLDSSEYETLEYEGADLDQDLTNVSKQNTSIARVSSTHRTHSPPLSYFPRRSDSSYDQGSFVRTVSREDSAPLSHPVPSLRSLEGGKLSNIERLEESAERLSINSDVGEGIRRLQLQQKRQESLRASFKTTRQFSGTSQTHSVVGLNSVARSGGFSPEAYVASPTASTRSPWSQSVGGHNQIQKMESPKSSWAPEDPRLDSEARVLTVRNSTDENDPKEGAEHHSYTSQEAGHHPTRRASVDTFQQAAQEFADFDGVHIAPREYHDTEHEDILHRLDDTPDFDDEPIIHEARPLHYEPNYFSDIDDEYMVPYAPPNPGQNMTYYPAPIPMMINLPPKLSKGPSAAEMAQRRSALLDLGSGEAGQSVGNLSQLQDSNKRQSHIPPQLRASLFFDQAPVLPDQQVMGGSATEILNRILAASADAPVTAFTDHPITGQEGAEVYTLPKEAQTSGRPAKSGRVSTHMSNLRKTSNSFLAFGSKLRIGSKAAPQEQEEEVAGEVNESEGEEEGDDDDQVPLQRPSTLLAELQIRKAQQRQRNRTAATAFPNGMHSTLLQLDAVAQVQKQSRSKKQVALAWEDSNANAQDDPEDDVPLGVLFPTSRPTLIDRAGEYPEDRPLGLLARKNLEDNEPLSHRRARLHNNSPNPKQKIARMPSSYGLNAADLTNSLQPAEEDETLGQRKRRLRGEESTSQARPLSSDFASEVLSQFGGLLKTDGPDKIASSTTPDPEETLGQRKRRLQAERQAKQSSSQDPDARPVGAVPTKRRSMADLLSANPVGATSISQPRIAGTSPNGLINQPSQLRTASTFQYSYPGATPRPVVPQRSWTEQQNATQMMSSPWQPDGGTPNTMVGVQPRQVYHPAAYAPAVIPDPPLHPQQRAMIDRWRQSIVRS